MTGAHMSKPPRGSTSQPSSEMKQLQQEGGEIGAFRHCAGNVECAATSGGPGRPSKSPSYPADSGMQLPGVHPGGMDTEAGPDVRSSVVGKSQR